MDHYIKAPAHVIEKVRDWAIMEFNFGEWQSKAEITDYMQTRFGYKRTTASQYASLFIERGVANQDFEKRLMGRNQEWRWIVHPIEQDAAA